MRIPHLICCLSFVVVVVVVVVVCPFSGKCVVVVCHNANMGEEWRAVLDVAGGEEKNMMDR